MKNKPQISDLDVFCVVVESQSFVGAATELGVSPAFISKRIQILEKTLDCKLLNRSTRTTSASLKTANTFTSNRAAFWWIWNT